MIEQMLDHPLAEETLVRSQGLGLEKMTTPRPTEQRLAALRLRGRRAKDLDANPEQEPMAVLTSARSSTPWCSPSTSFGPDALKRA
jgi:hypothetical protein